MSRCSKIPACPHLVARIPSAESSMKLHHAHAIQSSLEAHRIADPSASVILSVLATLLVLIKSAEILAQIPVAPMPSVMLSVILLCVPVLLITRVTHSLSVSLEKVSHEKFCSYNLR